MPGLKRLLGRLSLVVLAAAPVSAQLRPAATTRNMAAQRPGGLQTIAPGEYHIFYLVDGKILTIGSNRADELGLGVEGAASRVIPQLVAVPAELRFVDVAAGGYHSLAADSAGRVWTWGSNFFGQRGDGTPAGAPGTSVPKDSPTPQMIRTDSTGKPFDGVVKVGSMLWFNMAVKKDGTVWVWGKNDASGILGNGDAKTVVVNRPTQVPFDPLAKIVEVSASRDMILARDAKGGVWSWGGGADAPKDNRGSGSPDFARPHQLPGMPPIQQITVGDGFSLALDNDGELWGWGARANYLGLGPPEGGDVRVATPKKLSFPEFGGHKVTAVAASPLTVHVILDDGSLWGWGNSAMGGVGNGVMLDFDKYHHAWDYKQTLPVFRPVRIAPAVSNFKSVYTNALCFYVYAVTTDGKMYSWGRNKTGILGNGILPVTSDEVGKHPDSWNVPTATLVSPLTVKTATEVRAKQ